MLKRTISILAAASILSFGVIGCDAGINKEAIGKSKLQVEAAKGRQEALKERSNSRPPGNYD
ncbi:MAG: hypothetical protein DRQ56_04035 [Gammaproteobacteria bacterium]|nr:MAG: hypothetical protein DRQ56_04035 [Gammaproteobacteria bacterium]